MNNNFKKPINSNQTFILKFKEKKILLRPQSTWLT